jgi:hypothetical protein
MKVPVLGWTIDERFLMHRLRSTSIGGIAAILWTAVLFFRDLAHHTIRWDLFSIIATAAVVKIAVLVWYRLRD